uniref:Uncharacterized protein n=1 Tax=Anopheles christyi TaxID=43041 RepID=A0A182JSU5_9DIPT
MLYRLVLVSSLLLVLHVLTETEADEGSFLEPTGATYCPIPLELLERDNGTAPATDLSATCNQRRQEDDDKIKQAIAVIKGHLTKQAAATDPIRDAMNKFTSGLTQMLNSTKLRNSNNELEELRTNVLVAGIEAGRIPDAMTQYLILGAWNRWPEIVARIYQNTRRHRKHIENLLEFIRTVPSREDRLAFYHELKKHMVEKKDYESYLGAMFARDARHVVFAEDGKTPLNESDVKALYTTMKDGAVAYFRRALLTGAERYDLILLDRDHPQLFDLLFDGIVDVPQQEMSKFNSWKMMEALCRMERPMSKVEMFRKTAYLLLKHFKWEKENEFYAPMLAGYFEVCLPEIKQDPATAIRVTEVQNIFTQYKPKMNYQSIVKIIGKDIHAYAG